MISNQEYLLRSLPQLHPKSLAYKQFWKDEYYHCVDGKWVGGKWMPGNLYFYANYGTIEMSVRGSKTRSFGRPMLRDLEWNLYLLYAEARGFSGFSDDLHETCYRGVKEGKDPAYLKIWAPNSLKPDGTPKRYVNAREYLSRIHPKNLGLPLYENAAQNLMMVGPRGFGKSFTAGNIIAHEFLFDARLNSLPLIDQTSSEPQKAMANIIVGAGEAKFSSDLISKTRLTLENIRGEVELGSLTYPAPLSRTTTGSLNPGSPGLYHRYKKKIGGQWKVVGSNSVIKNRTFKDNPYAGQGNRNSLIVLEEIGMFQGLMASFNAMDPNTKSGGFHKFGTFFMIGTGGAMSSGGTLDAYQMMYNPEDYDILPIDDIWENTGKIGYFVPAWMGLNEHKDEEGVTNQEEAHASVIRERSKFKGEKDSRALSAHIAYYPLTPSEAFLTDQGSFFPAAEIMVRQREIAKNKEDKFATKVELVYDSKELYGISYKVDVENKLKAINTFPYKDSNREGAVVIYEMPLYDNNGVIPEDLYIIGHDPYASDNPDGESLASIYVFKTKAHLFKGHVGHDQIVAQFVGRPHLGRKIVNEILLKLSMFYGNATIYFENNVGNVKEFFEKRKKLKLLCKQPQTVLNKKASFDQRNSTTVYGYPMSNRQFKLEGIAYLRDWLLEERGENDEGTKIRNLDLISDNALLQELIQFNLDGNFDRVMGCIGAVVGLEEIYNQYENRMVKSKKKVDLSFITHNKSIFTNDRELFTLS
jgi:hypothetical protein